MKNNLRYSIPLHFVLFFTNWLPDNILFIRLRGWLASFFFKKCGKNLRLGRNLTFYRSYDMEIGNDVYIAYGAWFNGKIIIEDEVMFGPYVVISPGNHTKMDGSYRYGPPVFKIIRVGEGSWVGSHASLLLGAEVGKGTLIAANATLNIKAEDNSLYGGVPAKFIKKI